MIHLIFLLQFFLYLEKKSPIWAYKNLPAPKCPEGSGASYLDTLLFTSIYLDTEGTSRAGGDQNHPARVRFGCSWNYLHRRLQEQSACDCVCVIRSGGGQAGKLGKGNKKKRDNSHPHPPRLLQRGQRALVSSNMRERRRRSRRKKNMRGGRA